MRERDREIVRERDREIVRERERESLRENINASVHAYINTAEKYMVHIIYVLGVFKSLLNVRLCLLYSRFRIKMLFFSVNDTQEEPTQSSNSYYKQTWQALWPKSHILYCTEPCISVPHGDFIWCPLFLFEHGYVVFWHIGPREGFLRCQFLKLFCYHFSLKKDKFPHFFLIRGFGFFLVKFRWKMVCGFGEEDEILKRLHTDEQTDRQRTSADQRYT